MRAAVVVICLVSLLLLPSCVKPPKPPAGMVLIPGGTYRIGGLPDALADHPPRDVHIEPFMIDVHEATNSRYNRCVILGKCTRVRQFQPDVFNRPNQPVVMITIDQARTFCAFEGKSLPTREQWEVAARGKTNRRYPNGDETPDESANLMSATAIESYRFTTPVGRLYRDRSAFDAFDMTGNVSEFTLDTYSTDDETIYTAMGGNFLTPPEQATTFGIHLLEQETARALWLGVRCVKNVEGHPR